MSAQFVKRGFVVAGLLLSGTSLPATPVHAGGQESLYDILLDLGSARPNVASLIGEATGLSTSLDNCESSAPQFTLFLPSGKFGRGPLFDVLVDNSAKTLGQLLAKPSVVTSFLGNHMSVGLVSESMMTDPNVDSIKMKSGVVLAKTVETRSDGTKVVTVGGQVVVDGLKSIGHPNGYGACNGVVYLTNGIFNPTGSGHLSLLEPGSTLYDRIAENGAGPENPLQMLIDAAGLGEGLRDCREDAPEVTLFLPGPGGVAVGIFVAVLARLQESLGSLLARPDLVRALIENHIVDGLITPDDLFDESKDSFTARSGLELLKDVGTRPDGSQVVYINGHEVVSGLTASRMGATYETCSGALYFIDGFLSPERALAEVTFAWKDAGKKWGDNRFRFEVCEEHLPWQPSCVEPS